MTVLLLAAAALLVLLAGAEVFARLGLGLGDPPLWLADPEMEYLPVPSRSYARFGKRIRYNAYSMRARDFPATRQDPSERRVLVIGDSVVNGGADIDHDAVCTVMLEPKLAERLDRPVLVANASAGSWGPPNMLAYLKRFGLFDAELVVIVLNSGDYVDAPKFRPLDARMPRRKPLLAISELWAKYLPRYLRTRGKPLPPPSHYDPRDVAWCLESLTEMIRLARSGGADVLVVQHLKRSEIEGEPEIGHRELGRATREVGIEPIQLGPAFAAALREGRNPYKDGAHPNDEGQRIMAAVLLEPIAAALEMKPR